MCHKALLKKINSSMILLFSHRGCFQGNKLDPKQLIIIIKKDSMAIKMMNCSFFFKNSSIANIYTWKHLCVAFLLSDIYLTNVT